MIEATLHDGSTLELVVEGDGPVLLLPAEPGLGRALLAGLRDRFTVVTYDFQGNAFAFPKPTTFVPDNLAADMLAIADAAGASGFGYYGYSWLGVVGLQLALRTDRLTALVIGGWPPLNGPYAEMLTVTRRGLELSQEPDTTDIAARGEWATTALSVAQSTQFLTLYEALQGFDDRAAQDQLSCPRLAFAGARDAIAYPAHWGGVDVRIADKLVADREELTALGWDVAILPELDHLAAMRPGPVLDVCRPWLSAALPVS